MATRSISLPRAGGRPRSWPSPGWGERVALPVAGLTVVTAACVSLALALAGLPEAEPIGPSARAEAIRAPTLRAITRLDPLPGFSELPKSERPIGGLVFVRCTNLWSAWPDGSHAHRLLSMRGLASPTFSPDARTIAFLAEGSGGKELWTVAADGSETLRLGVLTRGGEPVRAIVKGLTWSNRGDRLAFALYPVPRLRGTSATIWTVDLSTGRFRRLGSGEPVPFWMDGALFVPDGGGVTLLDGRGWQRRAAERMSSGDPVASLGLAPGWWARQRDTAVIVRADEGLRLAVRGNWAKKDAVSVEPPRGYRIDPSLRPAALEGGPVAVTLLDRQGGRDLGLLHVDEPPWWSIVDYAWEPSWSPAPPALGPIEAQRAAQLVQDLLWAWDDKDPERASLLLERDRDVGLAPFAGMGHVYDAPERTASGWTVPVTVFGRIDHRYGYRDLEVELVETEGRLAAVPRAISDIEPIRTIDEAAAFLERILSVDVLPPAGLPAAARLAKDAVSAWTWGGRTSGSLNLEVPSGDGWAWLTVNYEAYGFGCIQPYPVTLATGTPALATDYGQVGFPAGRDGTTATYQISGELATATLLEIATAMDRERLAER